MKPDDIIKELEKLGVNISRKTLYNWEQWGLIPTADFKNSRSAEYPQNTVEYAYASNYFLNGFDLLGYKIKMPVGLTRKIRELHLAKKATSDAINQNFNFETFGTDLYGADLVIFFIFEYQDKLREARENLNIF